MELWKSEIRFETFLVIYNYTNIHLYKLMIIFNIIHNINNIESMKHNAYFLLLLFDIGHKNDIK